MLEVIGICIHFSPLYQINMTMKGFNLWIRKDFFHGRKAKRLMVKERINIKKAIDYGFTILRNKLIPIIFKRRKHIVKSSA